MDPPQQDSVEVSYDAKSYTPSIASNNTLVPEETATPSSSTIIPEETTTTTTTTTANNTYYHPRPQTSQSADFPLYTTYSPHADTNSPNMAHQQGMQTSRPPSGLSDATSRQTASYNHDQRSNGQDKAQNSVVIKVGMVGDAQIGKTSLMVKYVEGSWDEDYIQTLGEIFLVKNNIKSRWLMKFRCELYGEDNIYQEYGNHLFDLGSWWTKRIREYATACM
jgi:hypothetical protein